LRRCRKRYFAATADQNGAPWAGRLQALPATAGVQSPAGQRPVVRELWICSGRRRSCVLWRRFVYYGLPATHLLALHRLPRYHLLRLPLLRFAVSLRSGQTGHGHCYSLHCVPRYFSGFCKFVPSLANRCASSHLVRRAIFFDGADLRLGAGRNSSAGRITVGLLKRVTAVPAGRVSRDVPAGVPAQAFLYYLPFPDR